MEYDYLPDNYPSGCTNKQIESTIVQLEKEIKGNSRVTNIVANRATLAQLGQTELASRFTKKYSLLAFKVSIFSLILSSLIGLISLLISNKALDYAKIQASPIIEQYKRNKERILEQCKVNPDSEFHIGKQLIKCSDILKENQ